MINNEKGQALLEFVLILPIFLFMMFSFIDLGRIILENNRLESITTIASSKYRETEDYDEVVSYLEDLDYDVDLSITEDNGLLVVKVSNNLDLSSIGLGIILSNPYQVSIERTVNYE